MSSFSFVIDLKVKEELESRVQATKGVETGLVLGQASGGECLVLSSVPTPCQEDKSPVAVKTLNDIDSNWVIEHAFQVDRMMYGGVRVLGVYIIGGDSDSFTSEIISSFPKHADTPISIFKYSNGLEIKYVNESSKSKPRSAATPVYKDVLSELVTLSFTLPLNIQINLPNDQSKKILNDSLFDEIKFHINKIFSSSVYLIKGQQAINTSKLTEFIDNSNKTIQIDLLSDFKTSGKSLGSSSKSISINNGIIDCKCIVQKSSTVAQAIQFLQEDCYLSLKSRIQILSESLCTDDSNEDSMSIVNHLDKSKHLPNRVEIKDQTKSNFLICDYLLDSEAYSDISQRLVQLLDVKINNITLTKEGGSILKPTNNTSTSTTTSKPTSNSNTGTTSSTKSTTNQVAKSNNTILYLVIFSIVILLFSLIFKMT